MEKAKIALYDDQKEGSISNVSRIERLVSLKQIGTSIGPSFILLSVALCYAIITTRLDYSLLLIPTFFLYSGIRLIIFGWIKLIEQAEFAINLEKYLKKKRNDK